MKSRIFVGLCIALGWQVMGQTNRAATSSAIIEPVALLTAAAPSNEITTASGAVYKSVQVEKVEPDGLTVSYIPSGGGIGIVKIKFDQLSDEWKKQYGFDPQKKLDYEKLEQVAAGEWRAQLIANFDAAVARRNALEAAEAEAEAQALAEKEKQAAEAAALTMDTNQPETNVIQPPPLQETNDVK